MTPDEYSALLSETETSIDRLHALYEQWFSGIERREPLKQREIIQKRLDMFRTNMSRNTALRFRTQNLLSRWVTMTHHWTKISRQIEEGTFKRDVQKAKRKLEQLRAAEAKKAPGRSARDEAPKESPNPNALEGWDLDVDALDDAFDRVKDSDRPAVPMARQAAQPEAQAHSAFDDEGAAAVVAPRFSGGARIGGAPAVAPPTAVARPAAPGAPMGAPQAPVRPGPPAPAVPARPAAPSAPTAPSADEGAAPSIARALRAGPKVPPPPLPPSSAGPRAVPPATPARPPTPEAARHVPPPPPRPAAPPVPPTPAASGPDVRRLYDRYIEARRQNNERVDNVKFESVAASIEKMLPDLQKKHQGKAIDFEVVVKDGRVGFKPVPK